MSIHQSQVQDKQQEASVYYCMFEVEMDCKSSMTEPNTVQPKRMKMSQQLYRSLVKKKVLRDSGSMALISAGLNCMSSRGKLGRRAKRMSAFEMKTQKTKKLRAMSPRHRQR